MVGILDTIADYLLRKYAEASGKHPEVSGEYTEPVFKMALARSCRQLLKYGLQRPLGRPAAALLWRARCLECYVCLTQVSVFSHRSSSAQPPREEVDVMQELAPVKLPGQLAEWTGNVMYPNEESAVWDVTRQYPVVCVCVCVCVCTCVCVRVCVCVCVCVQGVVSIQLLIDLRPGSRWMDTSDIRACAITSMCARACARILIGSRHTKTPLIS